MARRNATAQSIDRPDCAMGCFAEPVVGRGFARPNEEHILSAIDDKNCFETAQARLLTV